MTFAFQVVLKTTLILLIAGGLSLLLRRSSAAVRHAVWALALLAVLCFPFASALLPPLELPILQEETSVVPNVVIQAAVIREPLPAEFIPQVAPQTAGVALPAPFGPAVEPWLWRRWLFTTWALGASVVLVRWLHAVWELRRLKKNSVDTSDSALNSLLAEVRCELGVTSRVQLRIASEPVPPMTWGVFQHVILLPASAVEWLPERRRLVLEHEMAHVKRRDGLGQVLSQVVCGLYWFNPLAWYAARQLHAECERACDDTVLRLGVEAADYADHLVDIARGLNSGFARTAFSMAHPSQLKSRVLAILDASIRRRRLSLRAGLALTVAGVLILPAAAVRVVAVAGLALPALPLPVSPAPAVEPQAPASQIEITPLPSGDASIEGRILSLGTNDPVRGARVILNSDPVSDSASVALADDNGHFEFPKIAAGKYQLLATKDGYVRGVYGQRLLNGPGTPIALGAGQSLTSLSVTMTPMGAISGKIRNRFGEPAGNVAVRALKITYQNGRRTLLPVQNARTNDLGDYRLYYLEPGQYLVSALPFEGPTPEAGGQIARLVVLPGSPFGTASPSIVTSAAAAFSTQGLMSAAETGETYVPLYFPGVADLAVATPIDLKPGAVHTSADFVVSEVRAAQIRGQVRDAAGQAVKGASVVLVPQGDVPGTPDRYGAVRDDVTLEFKGIAPGAYDLVAASGNLPVGVPTTFPSVAGGVVIDRSGAVSAVSASDTRLLARAPLRVASADIENVSLTLMPGFRINGKISFEGPSPAEAQALTAGLAVQLIPGSSLPNESNSNAIALQRTRSFSMPGAVGSDGVFAITGAFPGAYRIVIRGASKLPPGTYIKSARLDGVDVLSPRLNLETEPRGELEIVIGMNPGTLQVTVLDEAKAPAKIATVVLIPDPARAQRSELYFKAVTDSTGKVRLENIPPGTYLAFAWEAVEDGTWWDPQVLRKYEGQGKAIQIGASATTSVELKVVR
jgi:beta-lactamase regulating signal transducer with metallopeptidase domain